MKQTGLIVGLMACAIASVTFASRLWSWVLNFDPGFVFSHTPASTGAPLTSSVTILLVDGLRLDASRRMPTLNALRSRGADIEAQVGTPSFSRPGRATLAVGAPPEVHGVTTNRQTRALALDNLIRRVGALGGACRVAGSRIWSSLFSADIARCGSYLRVESKEGPGTFVTNIGGVRESEGQGMAFVFQEPAMLRILDLVSTDFAAHEYGGASSEYQAEVARVDRTLSDLLSHLDLAKETLIVTADHGHRDAGGHGGEEPEVLAIPVVMAGAGIRAATRAQARQPDIAPTVSALLGTSLPSGSSGRAIESVLLMDDAKSTFLRQASVSQQESLYREIADKLAVPIEQEGRREWRRLEHEHRDALMAKRTPWAILISALILAAVAWAVRLARPDGPGLLAGVLVSALTFGLAGRFLVPPMSFSAINYDEMLIPFFRSIMVLAACATVIPLVVALTMGRVLRKGPKSISGAALAGAVGLVGSAVLAGASLAAWLHHGLLSEATLPGPDQMVAAFALTLAATSVSLTSLLMMLVLRVVEGRSRRTA